jgi:glycosyltransferase involved in cell wall biosynthesis
LQQIKVANIVEEGRYAGPQVRILGVAECIRFSGIETIVLSSDKDSDKFYCEALKKNVIIRRIKINKLSRNLSSIFRYFITFPKEVYSLYQLLRKEKVDIVHCNSARQFKGAVAGKLARKKVLWHLNDTWSPFGIKLLFFVFSFMADCFITAGENVRRYYLKSYFLRRKPAKVIQAPVDLFHFDPNFAFPDERIINSLGIKVISIGNVNQVKGYELFIEAASYVNRLNTNVSFWIIGPIYDSQKSYYKKLKMLAQELNVLNLYFYGPSDDIRSILKATDIYVCSSRFEASPISVWEAMAMQKAIVSTDVGDVSKYINDGQNGYIISANDPEALSKKIHFLIENVNQRILFGKKARKTAHHKLSLSIASKKHIDIYQDILSYRFQ